MTSLLALQKPTHPQSFMMIYGFLFELWLNMNKEKKNAHHRCLGYDGQSPSFSSSSSSENEEFGLS